MHYIEYQNISAILRSDYLKTICTFAFYEFGQNKKINAQSFNVR